MASVSAVLPLHSEFQTDRLRWQDTADGVIDVSLLRADAGTAHVVRFQLSGNGADVANGAVIRTVVLPDGSSGTSGGPHLSDAAETYVSFATISVPGMTDLVLAGPNNANVGTQDATEPYQWVPGSDYTNGAITYNLLAAPHPSAGLAGWVGDFLTTFAADNTVRATLVLSDGVAGATPEQLAGLVTAGEPVVSGNAVVVNPVLLSGLVTAGEPAVSGNATIAAPAAPADTAMWAWVRSLHIPWIDNLSLPNRRLLAKGFADVMQHVVDDANAALQELWPATCSPAMLAVWGEVFTRPRRDGETAAEWRQRLVTWRAEPVGTSGWVRDEVERITGDDPRG